MIFWAIARIVVREKFIPVGIGYLRLKLAEENYRRLNDLSEPACRSIVHEALRQAALRESDGRPRWRSLFSEIDSLIDMMVVATNDPKFIPPKGRVSELLAFYRLI